MLISLTVGKVDAGLAILLTEDKRLIEFPSILLPAGITSGSIVDIQVSRNASAEAVQRASFQALQDEIYQLYGVHSPTRPVLRVRNATQTSIVLEWDPVELASANLRSLTLYRNGTKAGAIPNPTSHTSTKISGLAVDTEYTFQLVLRTSAGTYSSEKVTLRTHKMTDLSGITVCPGILPADAREQVSETLERIGAKPLQDNVRIDTTHFICTEGRGPAWERAQEMNIPVVRPEWIFMCEAEGRIVGVRSFYLSMDINKMRQSLPPRPRSQRPSVSSPVIPEAQKNMEVKPTPMPDDSEDGTAAAMADSDSESGTEGDKPQEADRVHNAANGVKDSESKVSDKIDSEEEVVRADKSKPSTGAFKGKFLEDLEGEVQSPVKGDDRSFQDVEL